ncbi:effector-associated domain EAD1-containing protein [Sorangium sp. So ce385]|uniref:effector-associated domain EAD1-containing protein n=1 Tax=Sorangium sp. So ce385 TaxID=3133308 RepID=UPI003F5B4342
MPWKPDALVELAGVLADLYVDEGASRRVVGAALLDAKKIAFSGRAEDNWFNILQYAHNQDRVDAVVDVAIREFPAQERRIRAIEEASKPAPPASGSTTATGSVAAGSGASSATADSHAAGPATRKPGVASSPWPRHLVLRGIGVAMLGLAALLLGLFVLGHALHFGLPCPRRGPMSMALAIVAATGGALIAGGALARSAQRSARWGRVAAIALAVAVASGVVVRTAARATFASSDGCDIFPRVHIEGRVVELHSKKAVAGAMLNADAYDFFAKTDTAGRFIGELKDIRRGEIITIHASHPGFAAADKTMKVNAEHVVMDDIELSPLKN